MSVMLFESLDFLLDDQMIRLLSLCSELDGATPHSDVPRCSHGVGNLDKQGDGKVPIPTAAR